MPVPGPHGRGVPGRDEIQSHDVPGPTCNGIVLWPLPPTDDGGRRTSHRRWPCSAGAHQETTRSDVTACAGFCRAKRLLSASAPVLYKVYDADGDGVVSRMDLLTTLRAVVDGIGKDGLVEQIVDKILEECDPENSGTIAFREFREVAVLFA